MRKQFLLVNLILLLCFVGRVPAQSLQWVNVVGPSVGAVNCFAVDSTTIFAGTADSGVYRSSDNGVSWVPISGSLSMPSTSTLWAKGESLIAGTFIEGLYRSENSGTSWEHIATGGVEYDYALFDNSGTIFAGTLDSGIYRTNDEGMIWQQINNGISLLNIHAFCSIGGNLFVGTHGDGVYRSTNNGDDWTPSSTGLPEKKFIHALAVCGTTMFVGTHYDTVFRSTDSGATWTPASNGISNPYIIALASSGNSIFVAASDGLYRSTNMGDQWARDMQGIPDTTTVLSIGVINGAIFAGTSSCGLFRAPLSNDAVLTPASSAGISFSIAPNPISANSIIRYSLDRSGEVTVTLFDPLGREVMQPISGGWQDAGEHEATIDARNLAPRIYECRLNTGDAVMTAKMVVLGN